MRPSLTPCFVDMNPGGLSLMHHFVTTTAKALRFGKQNGVDHVLRVHIPRLAIEHDFMLHVLLGVAALHKYHLVPNLGSHPQIAYHRAKAISGLRTAIGELSDKNAQGVLGASLFLVVLACDPIGADDESELWTATWFVLFAGMRQVINQVSWEYLVQTGLSPLFLRDYDAPAPLSAVPGPLREMVLSAEVDELDLEILSKTLQSLGSLYGLLKFDMYPRLGVKIGGWPANIEIGFAGLVKRMVPQALVITAYYMAFAKLPKTLWWLRRIPDREIKTIGKTLGCDWQPLMLIPLQVTLTQDRQEIVNLLLSHFPTDPVVLTDVMP
jgi:Fungal specific transcription factor domain